MTDAAVPYLFFTTCSIYWFLCVLQIFGLIWFNKLCARGLPIIDKRYPRFVMVEAVLQIFMLSIVWPAYMSANYQYPQSLGQEWWHHLSDGMTIVTFLIGPIIEICRIWLISYDLHHLHSSKNQQWKTEIDVSYAEKDWYLQHRGKWGNQQYVARLGFKFFIMSITAMLITWLITIISNTDRDYSRGIVSIVAAISGILLIIIPLYLYVKTPRNLQDLFLFQVRLQIGTMTSDFDVFT